MNIIAAIPIVHTAINWIVASISACSCNCPTDLVALERLLSSLSSSRSSLEVKFDAATLLVVIGVVVDVFVVLLEFQGDRSEYAKAIEVWVQGAIPEPQSSSFKLVFAGLLGAVLVAVGVAGEFWIEEKIGCIDNQIQQADNARANLLEKEAGDARASATEAENAASRADAEAENASIATAAADTELQKMKPRSFVRVPGLISDLNRFPGPEYDLHVFQDTEAIQFATALVSILKQSGWNLYISPRGEGEPTVTLPGIGSFEACFENGVHIYAFPSDSLNTLRERGMKEEDFKKGAAAVQAASALRSTLGPHILPMQKGNVADTVDPTRFLGTVEICVGKKP